MSRLLSLLLGSVLALGAGPAFAQLAPIEGPPPSADGAAAPDSAGADVVIHRPLLQNKRHFGAELYVRTTTGDRGGVDRSLFRFFYLGAQGRAGGGKSDLAFGIEVLLASPDQLALDTLDSAWISMRAAAGQSGALRLTLVGHNPSADDLVRRGVVDFGFDFKRSVHDRVAVIFGGGGDFVYQLLPSSAPDDVGDPWDARFYLHGGGQAQVTSEVAVEAGVTTFIPLVHSQDETDGPDSAVRFHLRGYYTLTRALDAYAHVGTFGEDDLRTSNGESSTWLMGIAGRL